MKKKPVILTAWLVFVVSMIIFLLTLSVSYRAESISYASNPGTNQPPIAEANQNQAMDLNSVVTIASGLSAVGSFVTGLVTSLISIRQRRMESQKAQLELEKLRLEVAQMRNEGNSKQ